MLSPYTASRSPASPCLGKPCDTIRQALPRPARARSENSWRPASRPALPDWRNAPPIRTAGAAAPGPVWPRHHLAGALLLRAFRARRLPWTGRLARHGLPAPWGKGDARRNQQAAFQRSGFRRRAVRSRRRPACAGCQGTLLLLPGRAGLACRFRAVTQPRLRAACEPASQGCARAGTMGASQECSTGMAR